MRARVAASIVLAVAIALGTSGCGFFTPQTTQKHYDASDGVSGNVGAIDVRNAIIVSGTGSVGNLVVTLVNSDSESHRVEIQRGSGSDQKNQWVTVAPNATKKLGSNSDDLVVFRQLDARPGSLYPVYFQYGDHTGVRLLVPVLNGGLPEYAHLVPSKIIPTPTPTPTPIPTPTNIPGETLAPTPSPTAAG